MIIIYVLFLLINLRRAPNNDLRPESLQTCKDNIYINVFDEIIVDVLEDERDRESTIHKRIQRNWLGTLTVPFATVYFKSKIHGTFKLDTPPIMLGYTRDHRLTQMQALSNIETMLGMESPIKESSYISLYITIEPQLLVPDAFRETVQQDYNIYIITQCLLISIHQQNDPTFHIVLLVRLDREQGAARPDGQVGQRLHQQVAESRIPPDCHEHRGQVGARYALLSRHSAAGRARRGQRRHQLRDGRK